MPMPYDYVGGMQDAEEDFCNGEITQAEVDELFGLDKEPPMTDRPAENLHDVIFPSFDMLSAEEQAKVRAEIKETDALIKKERAAEQREAQYEMNREAAAIRALQRKRADALKQRDDEAKAEGDMEAAAHPIVPQVPTFKITAMRVRPQANVRGVPARRTRVYTHVTEGEGFLPYTAYEMTDEKGAHVTSAKRETVGILRRAVKSYLKESGILLSQMGNVFFSQRAGCNCGCSPGFVLAEAINFGNTAVDIWIDGNVILTDEGSE